jgi:molybdopterin molybdotransferase
MVLAEFLRVISADQLVELMGGFTRLASERIPLDAALDRIVTAAIVASEDLPEGARSTVDGFAVRAEDTFGASDSLPAFLDVVATVTMGAMPDFEIRPGQAAQIPTGGFLPRGADAIVMVEYTNPAGSGSIEVTRPVTVRTNVLEKGEDARCGETLIPSGKRLRSQEIGFLASLGITGVDVYRKPRVAIISSGDEVVPIDRKPALGQIRDANSHAVAALVRICGGEPFVLDIVPDNADSLNEAAKTCLKKADVVALSGGSSVGVRDLMVDAVSAIPGVEILAHGVAIRPGKPTLLARQSDKVIVGLPGHPVSALIVAQVFLAPLLRYLQGCELEKGPIGHRVQATLSTSLHSTIGLEEYVRVRIEKTADGLHLAHPIFGKSGMLSTMVKADGIIMVPMNAEGLAKGKVVEVIIS